MSEVIPFGRKPPEPPAEKLAWACNCGCTSFFLLEDDTVQCCSCEVIGGPGGYLPYGDVLATAPKASKCVINHHVADFNLESVLRDASDRRDDLSAILLIYRDGDVNTWCTAADFETIAQEDWLRRRTNAGVNVILDKALDDMGIRGMRFPTRPKPRKKRAAGEAIRSKAEKGHHGRLGQLRF